VEPEVERDGYGPDLAEGVVALQVLIAVEHEERDLVAPADPHVAEGMGQPVHASVELLPGEARLAKDNRLLIGELPGVPSHQLSQEESSSQRRLDLLLGRHHFSSLR